MRREDAIKKLGKLLGKNFGYRVDPKAPDQDDRNEAKANLSIQRPIRDELKKQMELRLKAIIAADEEYQRLKAEHAIVDKTCEELRSMLLHYRFTVGVSNSMFFSIKAQGDNWEEIIAKLTKDKVPT